jgi:precorrin-2 dehydrogenase/sirohydrochlorin ferrochelatase
MADLRRKRCVVIGGGTVAERKIASLLQAGAFVTVISPRCSPQIEQWAVESKVEIRRELFGDEHRALLDRAVLIIAASDDAAVNRRAAEEAERLGKLANIADQPERSGFIVPSTLRRGKLVIAVSTSGASPGMSARIRRKLEEEFGSEFEPYLDLLDELRGIILDIVPDIRLRRQLFGIMLDWDLLPAIRSGHLPMIRERLPVLIREEPTISRFRNISDWLKQIESG